MISRILYFLFFFSTSSTIAQNTLLQCGPMVGYAEKDKALLWVQTTSPAIVKYKYWDTHFPDVLYYTPEDSARSDNGFVSKIFAQPLLPGRLYQYELYINDKPVS